MQVIKVSGKAKQVFKYMELLAANKRNVTLKELARDKKTLRLNLKS